MNNGCYGSQKEDDGLIWARLIDKICTRPRMYVLKGTFIEVCDWLEGFYRGLRRCNVDAVEEWDAFVFWLQRYFQYPRNWGWPRIFLEKYPEDGEAFRQLRLLYKQFLSERGSESIMTDK